MEDCEKKLISAIPRRILRYYLISIFENNRTKVL